MECRVAVSFAQHQRWKKAENSACRTALAKAYVDASWDTADIAANDGAFRRQEGQDPQGKEAKQEKLRKQGHTCGTVNFSTHVSKEIALPDSDWCAELLGWPEDLGLEQPAWMSVHISTRPVTSMQH